MDLQLGTMLYRQANACLGMVITKTELPLRDASDTHWVYGVEWYSDKPVHLKDSTFFSNSKYLSAYRHAYIELKRNINAS